MTIGTINLTATAPLKKGYPPRPKSYGDYLKQARLNYSLTQFELSLELEVYKSTIDRWERGTALPSTFNKQRIIQFLGFDPMQKETITFKN